MAANAAIHRTNRERRALRGLKAAYPASRYRYEERPGIRNLFYKWMDGSGEILFACEPTWAEIAAKLNCAEAVHA